MPIHLGEPERAATAVRVQVLPFAVFFIVTFILQWASGAYHSEFGGYPDEPAHVVTGLMVRAYITTFPPRSPMRFAEDFYLHYPEVAFGHWPPVFYIVEALWTILFPCSRTSLLLMMCTCTALTALITYDAAVRRFGAPSGWLAGLIFTSLPVVQYGTRMVLVEIPLTAFTTLAVLRFAEFLETGRWQDSAWFGIWAAGAILIKGNAWSLALVPPIAIVLSRRWACPRDWRFWLPLTIVVPACVPITIFTWKMIHNGWPSDPGAAGATLASLPRIAAYVIATLGWPLLAVAALGFVRTVVLPYARGASPPYWSALASMILAYAGFHAALFHGVTELRYFAVVAPAMLLFVCAGAHGLRQSLAAARMPHAAGLVMAGLAIAAVFGRTSFRPQRKDPHGFIRLAARLAADPRFSRSAFLISSSAVGGEGMFVAEMAMHDRRATHIILRATKLLAACDWTGQHYRLRYTSPPQLESALDGVPVSIVLIQDDLGGPPQPHQKLLEATMRQYAGDWRLSESVSYASGCIRVYQRVNFKAGRVHRITIDLSDKIDHVITGRF